VLGSLKWINSVPLHIDATVSLCRLRVNLVNAEALFSRFVLEVNNDNKKETFTTLQDDELINVSRSRLTSRIQAKKWKPNPKAKTCKL